MGGSGRRMPEGSVRYKRSRFSTRLPKGRLYTASHFWIWSDEGGGLQIGFTKFATRMLGDLVEFGFEVEEGETIEVGQIIGWVEGFKAATDLFSVVEGRFAGGNPILEGKIGLLRSDPYGRGWLYRAEGAPEVSSVNVEGYVEILDTTIDRIRGSYE
ncbi:MAG TPA: glycine cleavage system protein H [Acidobacteriota bacterium]|nr:glycine cleavage system protein H [Acidobacteriota bacterium]